MEPRIINKFLIVRELVTSACPFLRLTCAIPHTDLHPTLTCTASAHLYAFKRQNV